MATARELHAEVTLPDGSAMVIGGVGGNGRALASTELYDPVANAVSTLAAALAEPSDAVVIDGNLVIVESAAHRLTVLPLSHRYLDVEAQEYATKRATTDIAPGKFALRIAFTPPTGQHFDNSFGPATKLSVGATPPELLLDGAGESTELTRVLVINDATNGVLHVTVSAATCDDDVEHAACHLHQQDWGIPVRVAVDGADHLDLMLRGMAERTMT